MSDLAARIEEVRARVDVAWSDERARAVERGLAQRRRRRTISRAATGAALALLLLAGVARVAWLRGSPPLTFRDGSTATLLDGGSHLVARVDTPREVQVDLQAGGARFDVVHDPGRAFRVAAGNLSVEVLGTEFVVERAGENVRVAVERGAVRVRHGDQSEELRAGEERWWSAPPSAPPVADAKSTDDWKLLALEGDFDLAYRALGRRAPEDAAGDLLLAADVARLSHHPADAVGPLRRVVSAHRADPRAPLAAFTLGRVLLEDLGQPRDAADAFAEARALAPDGELAPDALAREVESWSRASEARRAHQLALDYSHRYPRGARLRAVRRYGGME